MASTNFKCSNCDKSFKTYKDLKKHKSEHEVTNEVYECSQCDKTFNEDWKMNAHIKTHQKFKCDKCDKSFKFLELLTKHVKISHENVKLYCHFFNNKKVCPFKEECLFLHEEADTCKYEKLCERMFCMFKHEYEDDEDIGDDVVNAEDGDEDKLVNVTEEREEDNVTKDATLNIVDIIDVQDDTEHDNDLSNTTFLNPSQTDEPAGDKMFKCEICDFATSSKKNLIDHKEAIHNWCSTCYSSFKNQGPQIRQICFLDQSF